MFALQIRMRAFLFEDWCKKCKRLILITEWKDSNWYKLFLLYKKIHPIAKGPPGRMHTNRFEKCTLYPIPHSKGNKHTKKWSVTGAYLYTLFLKKGVNIFFVYIFWDLSPYFSARRLQKSKIYQKYLVFCNISELT